MGGILLWPNPDTSSRSAPLMVLKVGNCGVLIASPGLKTPYAYVLINGSLGWVVRGALAVVPGTVTT